MAPEHDMTARQVIARINRALAPLTSAQFVHLVLDRLNRIERKIDIMADTVAVDTELRDALYAGLQTLAPFVDNLVSEVITGRSTIAELRGERERDTESDAAELRPLVEIVTGLRDKLAPAVQDAGPVKAPQSAAEQVAAAPEATPDTDTGQAGETGETV